MLKLFWLDFEAGRRHGFPMGVGITAEDETDAVDLAKTRLFASGKFPTAYRIEIIPIWTPWTRTMSGRISAITCVGESGFRPVMIVAGLRNL
ncbi:hypothetical protein [Mesorhizobium sp. M0816]|uniref:hypothetical protein n=1 Tax=Mesorhizobium sp. M0816 TaxID=2957006 RepID=UPI0033370223